MEVTRSRNVSGRNTPCENEREFLTKLKKNNDSSQDVNAKLKIKIRPLRQQTNSGLQIFLIREDDPGMN